ncbi:hypothetical protein [Streptomyces mexicanus]|nr:hypothetical protein [Streptomyces mexicanus]
MGSAGQRQRCIGDSRHAPRRAPSPITYVLLIAVPALAAVAALRPR